MDFSFLSNYVIVVVVGLCMCFGYVLNTIFDSIPNKYIPLIMLCLGTAINVVLNRTNINVDVILGGMVSGLASTGLHQAVHQIKKDGNSSKEDTDSTVEK